MLVISPYDKSCIREIEKAIMQSDLGMTPSNDGSIIRLNVPQLTAVSPVFAACCACMCHVCVLILLMRPVA